MKKSVVLLVVVTMILLMCLPVYANDSMESNVIPIGSVECDFGISQHEAEDDVIIRTYQNNAGTGSENTVDCANIKRVLLALGMGQAFIDELTEEDLVIYANSQQIVSMESYLKQDTHGESIDQSGYGPKHEVNARDLILPPHVRDESATGTVSESTQYENSNIKILYIVTQLENGRYRFSVDAEWLGSPNIRLTDSLGACSQNFTVENNTRSGWYSYTKSSLQGTSYSNTAEKETLTDFCNAVNGNWYGSAVLFDLKSDSYVYDYSGGYYVDPILVGYTVYSSHKVHYQFEGIINYPTIESYFNTTATYEHATISLEPNVSVAITTAGATASIGLNGYVTKESYTAEFNKSIHYIPD